MLQQNSDLIMERLKPSDLVLDIGGWAHPFNRANYVMDCEPFETRGYYNRTFARNHPIAPIGGTVEHFTRERWIQRDICEKAPFPFKDKELDFVICSHTLEDIRDPLWVCSEMIRTAKAGYIEVPSRIWESCRGHEPGIAGLSHHRWLIEISPRGSVEFLQKYHRLHNWRCSLPKSVLRSLTEAQSVQWLFWEDSFEYCEIVLHGNAQLENLEDFVQRTHPYPKPLLSLADLLDRVTSFQGRVLRKLHQVCGIA